MTLPLISPSVFYLVITGFIGAFKAYSDAVALFGTNLNAAGMNTLVGYVFDMLYRDGGAIPPMPRLRQSFSLQSCSPSP